MQLNTAVTITRTVTPKVTSLDHGFTSKRAFESVVPHQAALVSSYLVFPHLPLPPLIRSEVSDLYKAYI